MNVLSEVLVIAFGTALLAALIVAANVDLAVIQAWQDLRQRWVGGAQAVAARRAPWAPEPAGWAPEPAAWAPERAEVTPVPVIEARPTAADEWLAAAAAHQLEHYRRNGPTPDQRSQELVATPLREVLAARRNGRQFDTAA